MKINLSGYEDNEEDAIKRLEDIREDFGMEHGSVSILIGGREGLEDSVKDWLEENEIDYEEDYVCNRPTCDQPGVECDHVSQMRSLVTWPENAAKYHEVDIAHSGQSVPEALRELENATRRPGNQGKCLVIVTGRGLHSPDHVARIQRATERWLNKRDMEWSYQERCECGEFGTKCHTNYGALVTAPLGRYIYR